MGSNEGSRGCCRRSSGCLGTTGDSSRGDVIAGIAVTGLVVRKNLGYAGIAGVPLQNGLYAAAAGAIIYAQVLIPPDSGKRKGERPGWTGGRYSFMRRVLATELGKELYRKRQQSIEPVYGHTKHNRRLDRFHRRGRMAVRTESRLITMSHNLTKLHRHQIATVRA